MNRPEDSTNQDDKDDEDGHILSDEELQARIDEMNADPDFQRDLYLSKRYREGTATPEEIEEHEERNWDYIHRDRSVIVDEGYVPPLPRKGTPEFARYLDLKERYHAGTVDPAERLEYERMNGWTEEDDFAVEDDEDDLPSGITMELIRSKFQEAFANPRYQRWRYLNDRRDSGSATAAEIKELEDWHRESEGD
jgi:hypothetical protein